MTGQQRRELGRVVARRSAPAPARSPTRLPHLGLRPDPGRRRDGRAWPPIRRRVARQAEPSREKRSVGRRTAPVHLQRPAQVDPARGFDPAEGADPRGAYAMGSPATLDRRPPSSATLLLIATCLASRSAPAPDRHAERSAQEAGPQGGRPARCRVEGDVIHLRRHVPPNRLYGIGATSGTARIQCSGFGRSVMKEARQLERAAQVARDIAAAWPARRPRDKDR